MVRLRACAKGANSLCFCPMGSATLSSDYALGTGQTDNPVCTKMNGRKVRTTVDRRAGEPNQGLRQGSLLFITDRRADRLDAI